MGNQIEKPTQGSYLVASSGAQDAHAAIHGVVRRFLAEADFRHLSRLDWRCLAIGHDRALLCKALIDLAEGALSIGTREDARHLYCAAHAVLPLRGRPLGTLAGLLITSRPVDPQWADVLVEVLARTSESDEIDPLELRNALTEALETAAQDADLSRMRKCLARQASLDTH